MTVPQYISTLLGDVDDSEYFGLACSSCHCIRRLSLERLRDLLGGYFKVSELRRKLTCFQCSASHLLITFLTPLQNGQRTERLFERKVWRPAEH